MSASVQTVSLAGLHASRLAGLAPSLRPDTLARIAATERLRPRLLSRLPGLSPALPEAGSPAELLALRPAALVAEAGIRMGAAWHARRIARCIGAGDKAALEQGIGREARLLALGLVGVAVAPADTLTAADLVAAVRVDGLRCLARWRDRLEGDFAALAALRLPVSLPEAAGPEADPILAAVLERLPHDG